jgi:hypothetical protein
MNSMRRLSAVSGVLVVVLLLAVAAPAAAAQQVTFKGWLAGNVTVAPLTFPLEHVLIEASGNATQLGKFTLNVPHEVNLVLRTGTGTYEFTAANGDRLNADFTGLATLEAPLVVTIHETGIINGGTGRFAGATGSFTVDRTFYLDSGLTVGSFEGTISSVGHGA